MKDAVKRDIQAEKFCHRNSFVIEALIACSKNVETNTSVYAKFKNFLERAFFGRVLGASSPQKRNSHAAFDVLVADVKKDKPIFTNLVPKDVVDRILRK